MKKSKKIFVFLGTILIISALGLAVVRAEKNELLSSQSMVYINESYNYRVSVPKSLVKIEDTGSYVAWLPEETYNTDYGRGSGTIGAKYGVAVLENNSGLSVEGWLRERGGEEPAPLVSSEIFSFKGIEGKKYVYGNFKDTSVGRHINIYLPVGNVIYAFVIFPFQEDSSVYESEFYKLIESFNFRY